MKKKLILALITAGLLACFALYFPANKTTTTLIIPYEDPLFITNTDLLELRYNEYQYINNEKDTNNEDNTYTVKITFLPHEDDSLKPDSSMYAEIYKMADENSARKLFDLTKTYSSKINTRETLITDNYLKIAENNFLATYHTFEGHKAYISIIYKNYRIGVAVDSIDDKEKTIQQAGKLANMLMAKVKNL